MIHLMEKTNTSRISKLQTIYIFTKDGQDMSMILMSDINIDSPQKFPGKN